MSNYENAKFVYGLPSEDTSVDDLQKLLELRNKIDNKLRILKAKINIANFKERIILEEKQRHIKGTLYFSPMKGCQE